MSTIIDFARLFRDLPAPYMMLDTGLRFIDVNHAYEAVTGRKRDELIGRYVFDAFPERPERLEKFGNAFRRALAGETNCFEHEPFAIAICDGDEPGLKEVSWTTHQMPVYDTDGTVIGVLQKALDVTAEMEAERTRDIVVREFDHRQKNLLAKVSAITHRTAADCSTLEEFLAEFDDRMAALARTQNLLMRRKWAAVPLRDLIEAELAPYRGKDDAHIRASGPDLLLNGPTAQALGMALHELATNAAKYGGLANADRMLQIEWRHDPQSDDIMLDWQETGFAVGGTPDRSGFGSTIIDLITPREVHGAVERTFDGNGHRCHIRMPARHALVMPD
ncbi:MAG: HWE histidine kinase domain-containing protein [Blastomonas sp.]